MKEHVGISKPKKTHKIKLGWYTMYFSNKIKPATNLPYNPTKVATVHSYILMYSSILLLWYPPNLVCSFSNFNIQ